MADKELPVRMSVTLADGSNANVVVGTAVRDGDGFRVRLNELRIGDVSGRAGEEAPRKRAAAPASSGGGGGGGGITTLPNYGRSKGAPIEGASLADLEFYANGARRSLNDPSKSRWHDKERQLLAAIEAEIARQGGGGGDEDGPPPPTDDDIQF